MPFLRFTRDRRGYENTFLVHTTRRRGKEHAQILYWFRSPPHVKVGRAALDPEAIRAIEQAHADITFDWTRILEAKPPAPEPLEDSRPRQRTREREGRGASSRGAQPTRSSPTAPAAGDLAAKTPEPAQWPAPEPEENLAVAGGVDHGAEHEPEETNADATDAMDAAAAEESAAERALGAEGLQRIRARYAEVVARIGEQITDAERADALREVAEGLNPDSWVTRDEVVQGLESFEQRLDAIRRELGPLRRRSHRAGRRRPGQHPGTAAATAAAADGHADSDQLSRGEPDRET